ncbi:Clp protease N-terminal domain-containing protein [Asanoa sp. WMMD1127]|uniref:Clp protease N-terminal domain-containing protein n=1 Tax=Asanoa sp. WMMD1127 TaxID=3016107 RepID=UPI0024166F0E|nr:Clp protease N-terminal domain-containing protein [Asanoa sp. WMMD1127]MDG4823307.1 Clp protease N-terminal domain-containing protein [Asanoa sp. WMMD1127]
MAPLDVSVDDLIIALERDLPDADPVVRVGEARSRARALGDLGDQLIDHFIRAARQSGASWSQIGDAMGVSKQAAQQRGTSRFARFTERPAQVVKDAQALARERRDGQVEPEHVLVTLLGATEALAAKLVRALGADPAALAETVTARLPAAPGETATEHVPFSAAAKKLLEETTQSALDLGHNYVGTEHILLGLLRMPETPAGQVLHEAGFSYDRTKQTVETALLGFQHRAKG